MLHRSTWLHLRFPFSFFLLPIFVFALATAHPAKILNILIVFVCLHVFIYPASNGYNSYFDRDEESIGGLKHPPPVRRELYWASLVLDGLGLLLAWSLSWRLAFLLLVYGLISKAYSHPGIRLKKRPILGWLAVGFFQGYFTFVMSYIGLVDGDFDLFYQTQLALPGALSSLMLWASYPMTQIYQHREDANRGDITLSLRLGVLGTFHFTALFFSLAVGCFLLFFFGPMVPISRCFSHYFFHPF